MSLPNLVALGFAVFLVNFQCDAANLRVAVASNFAPVLTIIANQYQQEFNQHIDIVQGSTGKFYAQIKQGAPFDIFLAADVERPARLEQEAMIVPNSRKTYATGLLVLWSARNQQPIKLLSSGQFDKLAIANPKLAPYGVAAIEVLQYLNLYEQVKNKLVYGENVSQAFQFVQSGSADLGFAPLSQVKDKSFTYWTAPSPSYRPIEQQLVILKNTRYKNQALQFVGFLTRADIKTIIISHGYQIP